MNKIIGIACMACLVILLLAGNSALAQSLNWGGVNDLSATLQDASGPQIALSSDGTKATAVWYRTTAPNFIIQSKSATISGNTATWGSVTDLSLTGQSAYDPQIALSSDGTKATAVWYRWDGSNYIIQSKSASISGNTATWGSVTDLSATLQNADVPQITLSSDGTKATAVWHHNNGSNYIIQSKSASISGNTATWGSVTDLSATLQDTYNPQIALSSDGTKATAVWYRYNGSNWIIQSKSATISGNTATWSSVTNLSAAGQDAQGPQIALSSDGTKATAVWYRTTAPNYIIQSASATISGNTATWSSVTNLSAAGQDAEVPQIALSSDGTKATAVWYRYNGSNNIIQSKSATISGNTATWGSVTDLSATGQSARYPHIALSSDGTKATAVWRRYNGSNYIIQSKSASISGNTATWGSVTDLSATLQDTYEPQIALSSDGTKATAVWSRWDGSNNIIQSKSGIQPPSAPSSITASDGTSTNHVATSWNSSSGATSYKLYRCASSSTGSCGGAVYSGSSTSHNDTAATAGTTYYYRAKACNSAGCSTHSSYDTGFRAVAGVTPPSVPSSITASDGTSTSHVATNWSVSSGATSYALYRCTNSSASSCGNAVYTGSSTSYNDTGATLGETYYYRAKACNSGGCSTYSNYDTGYRAATVIVFDDVPTSHPFYNDIQKLVANNITGGCSVNPPLYCPSSSVTRDQMAVFLERVLGNTPPPATGTMFDDVPSTYWAAPAIEQFAKDGITSGCSTSPPLYCPGAIVSRDQMAVFLLRTKYGFSYQPPAATGNVFTDVSKTHWAASWIEQLVSEGITGGCAAGLYCPDSAVNRGQMAAFIVRMAGY